MEGPLRDSQFWPSGGGENSIADSFDVWNWRPDSETVASRAFAQASVKIKKSLEVGILINKTEC